jgi:hypothetical protein
VSITDHIRSQFSKSVRLKWSGRTHQDPAGDNPYCYAPHAINTSSMVYSKSLPNVVIIPFRNGLLGAKSNISGIMGNKESFEIWNGFRYVIFRWV